MQRRYVSLSGVSAVRHGDVLLFRGGGLLSRVIRGAGRGEYSHAGMAAYWHLDLFLLEVRWIGARVTLLEREVRRRAADTIDVYRVTQPGMIQPDCIGWWDGAKDAVRVMRRLAGEHYGWRSLARTAVRHLPLIRCILPPLVDDALTNGHAPYCSQAVAHALRAAGVDPVPNLADQATEPSDLARSAHLAYQFTLRP